MEKYMKVKEFRLKNIPITMIETNKFKTISVFVYFKNKLTRENTTIRSLLSRVLAHSTKELNTKARMTEKLQSLYDAIYGVHNQNIHEASFISYHLEIVDEELVGSHTLFHEAMQFLGNAIFSPNADNGAFNEKVVQEQKRLLQSRIENIYNNKDRFAYKRFLETMASNEPVGISTLGYLEELEKIDARNLYEAYLDMLSSDEVSVILLGNVSELKAITELSFVEDFTNKNSIEVNLYQTSAKPVEKVQRVEEIQDLNQSKLLMGYRIDIPIKHQYSDAVTIFNAMFGGLFVSNLFREVREKHSLAYSVFSHHLAEACMLIVRAGVDEKNVDKAIAIIKEELEKYKNKKVSKPLFDIAKENVLSELDALEDSPNGIANFIHRQTTLQEDLDFKAYKARFEKVKLKDVLALVQSIELDTIYVLKGGSKS